jgi:hypothetical protein
LSLEHALPAVQVTRPESSCCKNDLKSLWQGLITGVPLGVIVFSQQLDETQKIPVLSCE